MQRAPCLDTSFAAPTRSIRTLTRTDAALHAGRDRIASDERVGRLAPGGCGGISALRSLKHGMLKVMNKLEPRFINFIPDSILSKRRLSGLPPKILTLEVRATQSQGTQKALTR